MSSPLCAWKRFVLAGLLVGSAPAVLTQNAYTPQGGEYPIAGYLRGDQVYPQISAGTNGGYVVWQDNVTDGDGLGISAKRINSNLLGLFGVFRVNEQAAGDQENVRLAMLKDGGAVFAWQGGNPGFQHIYARFLKGDGTFASGDRLINTYTNNHQLNPALAVLPNGNVVITWSSYGQDGDMYGVYGQLLSPNGDKIGSEFQVSQSTSLNQRSASATALADGGFALVWVGERPTTRAIIGQHELLTVTNFVVRYTAEILGRMFDSDGQPRAGEFRISTSEDACANPVVAASVNGGFSAAWGQRDGLVFTNGWDIFARCFGADGLPLNPSVRLNTYTFGDQIGPKIATLGSDNFVVWTSVGQDASREEVYGRFLSSDGVPVGDEIRINTTTVSQQIHPAIASDGASRFVVVWSSFIGGDTSFDLFAQRYAISQSLPTPDAPFISALSNSKLSVTWPEVSGYTVDHYELYIDSRAAPILTGNNIWTVSNLLAGSAHTFKVAYVLTDGRRSAVSASATGTTWGEDENLDGLPDDWQAAYWGADSFVWPASNVDSDGDGATNLQEFLAGTNPNDPSSIMRAQIVTTSQGTRLSWNCQPGLVYQAQMSTTLAPGSWTAVGTARFAAGSTDSVLLNGTNAAAYYRVIRLRQ
jgi:hypothetical protein